MNTFARDNAVCLGQAKSLLRTLPGDCYTRVCPECLDSSIGAHLRHAIEHYQSFAHGYGSSEIDYDERERNTEIETSPEHAIKVLDELEEFLETLVSESSDRQLRIKMDCGSNDLSEEEKWTASTVARELQFLLSHAIHHYALIAVICRTLGLPVEEGFGVAPSTLRHRKACAQ